MHAPGELSPPAGGASGYAYRCWPRGRCSSWHAIAIGRDSDAASWSPESQTPPVTVSTKSDEATLIDQARRDALGLLSDALDRYDQRIGDYEGVFAHQEVFRGKLRELTVCRFKFRQKPFSVAMHITEGVKRADRMLYVEGKHDGKLLVHPAGFLGRIIKCTAIDPEGPGVREDSSRTIKEFGLRNMLTGALKRFEAARRRGDLRINCMGVSELGGRRALVLQGKDRLGDLLIELDVEHLVPLRIRQHDPSGRTVGLFWFKELRLNPGLTDAAFSKAANGLAGRTAPGLWRLESPWIAIHGL